MMLALRGIRTARKQAGLAALGLSLGALRPIWKEGRSGTDHHKRSTTVSDSDDTSGTAVPTSRVGRLLRFGGMASGIAGGVAAGGGPIWRSFC